MWSEISRKVYALESPCCSGILDARLLAGKQASYLPEARDEGDARHTPEDAGGARTAGSSLYVALVGHEHQQADQLARLLTQQGFQVGVFDAWPERASAAGVDLIVLDLGDAAADQGVELIARVRSQVSNMPPILALTVAAAESDLASLYDAGADDVMFKPCASRCSRRACGAGGASIRARSSRQTCSESALMPSTWPRAGCPSMGSRSNCRAASSTWPCTCFAT